MVVHNITMPPPLCYALWAPQLSLSKANSRETLGVVTEKRGDLGIHV